MPEQPPATVHSRRPVFTHLAAGVAGIAVGVAATVAVTSLGGEDTPPKGAGPETFTLTGTMTLTDNDGITTIVLSSDQCAGKRGYSDIRPGAPIREAAGQRARAMRV